MWSGVFLIEFGLGWRACLPERFLCPWLASKEAIYSLLNELSLCIVPPHLGLPTWENPAVQLGSLSEKFIRRQEKTFVCGPGPSVAGLGSLVCIGWAAWGCGRSAGLLTLAPLGAVGARADSPSPTLAAAALDLSAFAPLRG